MASKAKLRKRPPLGSGRGPARELSSAELARLLAACNDGHGARDAALVWLCVGAGLRVGEAVALTIGDVATGSAPRWKPKATIALESGATKSGRGRVVHVAPQAMKAVGLYLASRGDVPPDAPLFRSQRGGGGLHPNYGVRRIGQLMARAGIVDASSHSLRRTHANTLRKNGADLTVIKAQLGHASIATTSLYLEAAPAESAEAVAALRFG